MGAVLGPLILKFLTLCLNPLLVADPTPLPRLASPPDAAGFVALPTFPLASPGTTPAPVRRAISARIALSHLISSSSLGAHNNNVLFVVTILNVKCPCESSGPVGGELEGGGIGALCL